MTLPLPADVFVTPGDGRARVSWRVPATPLADGSVHTHLLWGQENDEQVEVAISPLIVSGLNNGQDYEFRLRLGDEGPSSGWGEWVEKTIRPYQGLLYADPELALRTLVAGFVDTIPQFRVLDPDETAADWSQGYEPSCRFSNNGGAQWGTRPSRTAVRRRVDCYTYAATRAFARYLDGRVAGFLSTRGAGSVVVERPEFESDWHVPQELPTISDRIMVYDCRADSQHDTFDPAIGRQDYAVVLRSYQVWMAPWYLDSEPFMVD